MSERGRARDEGPPSTTGPADRPGVAVRPPLLYGGALAVGLALERLWPLSAAGGARYAGAALALAGATLLAWAIAAFRRAGTNVPTSRPALALVRDGPYRFSRNPIYLGLSALLAGLGLAAGTWWTVLLLAPALVALRYGVIAREEAYLARKFGAAYDAYKASVRRWL